MAEDHFIELIWAKNEAGAVVASVKLGPNDKPELTFPVPEGTTTLTAFEYCNKHGTWSSEAVAL